MNIRTMNRMAIFVATLAITCLALSGCHRDGPQSGISGTASLVALHGVYISPTFSTGHNILIGLDINGAMIYLDGTYDKPNNMIYGNCIGTGMAYTLVGTTVRFTGGQMTDYGRAFLSDGAPLDASEVTLMTVTDDGQSLSYTLESGTVVKLTRQ